MEIATWDSKVLGVVMDLSLRHAHDGKRILDHAKAGLISYLRDTFDDDDVFYLFHPQILETMNRIGEEIGAISNFETDGWEFDLNYALQQSLYVVGAEGEEFQKYLVLITDRLDVRPIQRLLKIQEREGIECKFVVFSVGGTSSESCVVSVPDVMDLGPMLKESLKYGADYDGSYDYNSAHE